MGAAKNDIEAPPGRERAFREDAVLDSVGVFSQRRRENTLSQSLNPLDKRTKRLNRTSSHHSCVSDSYGCVWILTAQDTVG